MQVRTIYLDHAATAYPRHASVGEAMLAALDIAGSAGRGGHGGANQAKEIVTACRERLARLWGVESTPAGVAAERIVIYPSATAALNTIIDDFAERSDATSRLLLGPLEHNSVTRPAWRRFGTERIDTLPADVDGSIDIDRLDPVDTGRTVAVIVQHASNVNGVVQPIEELAEWCDQRGLPLIVDGAQAAGLIPVLLSTLPAVRAYVAAGHKFLGGPPGIGVAYYAPGFDPTPLWIGGNGVDSGSPDVPTCGPARYESGTSNLPAIAGLGAALERLTPERVAERLSHTTHLRAAWLADLQALDTVDIIGDQLPAGLRTPVISLRPRTGTPAEVSERLDAKLSVRTRAGLHCAPKAHAFFGTTPDGTFRIAPDADPCEHEAEDRRSVIDFLRTL